MEVLERVREAMPSEEMQRIFGEMVETVRESGKVEES
jgi:hypothetical protein